MMLSVVHVPFRGNYLAAQAWKGTENKTCVLFVAGGEPPFPLIEFVGDDFTAKYEDDPPTFTFATFDFCAGGGSTCRVSQTQDERRQEVRVALDYFAANDCRDHDVIAVGYSLAAITLGGMSTEFNRVAFYLPITNNLRNRAIRDQCVRRVVPLYDNLPEFIRSPLSLLICGWGCDEDDFTCLTNAAQLFVRKSDVIAPYVLNDLVSQLEESFQLFPDSNPDLLSRTSVCARNCTITFSSKRDAVAESSLSSQFMYQQECDGYKENIVRPDDGHFDVLANVDKFLDEEMGEIVRKMEENCHA
jgi:hypothetical protein